MHRVQQGIDAMEGQDDALFFHFSDTNQPAA